MKIVLLVLVFLSGDGRNYTEMFASYPSMAACEQVMAKLQPEVAKEKASHVLACVPIVQGGVAL